MAYNEELAQRMRSALQPLSKNIEEKWMFGGLAFMYKNKMACGVMKDDMMVRVVADKYEDRLKNTLQPVKWTLPAKQLRTFSMYRPAVLKRKKS